MQSKKAKQGPAGPLLVFTIYSLLTVLLTWPTAATLGSHIPGQLGDGYVHLWTFEWLKSAVLNGQDLFETKLIFYPVGVSLLNHNIAWVNFAFWLPLQALFGSEVGYSLAFMLIFPLNGLALYLFIREVVADTAVSGTAAFLGGLIGAFLPYNLSHHDHPNLILIAWVPLTMLYFLRLQRSRRWQDALLAGTFTALIGLTRWQLLLMAAPLLGIFLLWQLIQNRRKDMSELMLRLTLAGGVALLFILPFFTPLLRYQLSRNDPQEILVEEAQYPTDLLAFLTPGSYHPIWGDQIQPLTLNFVGNPIYVRFVGYSVLLLAGIGLFGQWRKTRFWLLGTAVYLLLALGPTLYWAGKPTIPLPFQLIEESFLVQTLRFPDRFNVLLLIPVSLLAAWGVVTVLRIRPFSRFPSALPILLTGLILFEYANEFQMLPLDIPSWFETVAVEETESAILDIPAFTDEAFNKQYMRYQLIHKLPLVEGRIARPPQAALQFFYDEPFLKNLLTNSSPPATLPNQSQQINQLAAANVEYIVLHRQFLSAEEMAAWQDWFIRPFFYQDDEITVYRTDPLIIGEDVPLMHTLYEPDAFTKMGVVTLSYPEQAAAGSWLTVEVIWGATAPLNQRYSVCLIVRDHEQLAQQQCQPVSEAWPTNRWRANAIVRSHYSLQVDPFLTAERYWLSLQLTATQQPIGQAVTIGEVSIAAVPRQFTPTVPQHGQTAVWQDVIELRGYDLTQAAESITLALHWHALQRMEASYKFFVHLIDNSSGEIVAQLDYVPREWTYPTNGWEVGEYVVDTAVLPLNNVASGSYTVQIGIYDPDSGERLLATSSADSQPADTVVLTEILR